MRDEVLDNIIEKMASDPEFMKQLESKPGKALFEAGMSWEEVAEIKKAAVSPETETLGERSSAGMTAIGKIWYDLTGACGCSSNWSSGSNNPLIAFCN